MDTLREIPSVFVLVAIGLVISCAFALRWPRKRLLDVALDAAALSALVYILFEIVVRGPAPLFVIGLAIAFALYLPMSFLTGLAFRALLRRNLNAFRDGPGG